jgi:hypothetical protein
MWMTVPKALIELHELRSEETDPAVLTHLVEIEQFLTTISRRHTVNGGLRGQARHDI